MNITMRSLETVTVLRFDGALDTKTSAAAEQQINSLISSGVENLVIDFEPLSYISSVGLGVLLATAKKLRASGGRLRIYGLNEAVRQVFDLSGFSVILQIFEREAEALQGL